MPPSRPYSPLKESDDDDDSSCILEIDLDSLESARTVLTARRITTSNFDHKTRLTQEHLNIATAMIHQSGNGEEQSLRIITRSPEREEPPPRERWLHIASESIRFDEFKRFALNVTLEHHGDWVPAVMYLLNDVKDNYEHRSEYGSYIKPGTVLRCDGTERRQRHKPDVSVTFISFPFFDVGKAPQVEKPSEDAFHLTRSLFQQFYPQELTKDRDDDQQFRRFRQTKKGQYLRVPQLWALILNSQTIITCGPSSLGDLGQDWLEIVPEDSLVSKKRCIIHVTDFHNRTTLLSTEQCGSFLALKQTIQKQCLSKTQENIDKCNLHLGDSETMLEPGQWPALLRETNTAFLYIRISRKRLAITAQGEGKARLEAPDAQKLIEYTDLGSDDESGRGRELVLSARSPRYKETTRPTQMSETAISIQTRLEELGYVVNKKQSLMDHDALVFQDGKPRIFKRPTIVEIESESESDLDSDTPSIEPAHQIVYTPEDQYEADSERGVRRTSKFAEKRVRFQIVSSNDDRQDEYINSSMRTEEDVGDVVVLGASHSSSGQHEASPETTTDSTRAISDEETLIGRNTSSRAFEPAGSTSMHARVEDYESEASSSDDEGLGHVPDVLDTGVDDQPAISDGQSSMLGDDSSRSGSGQFHKSESKPSSNGLEDSLDAREMSAIIRDEIAAALKHNEAQIEMRLEREGRARLAQFGFQENQIQAILNPKEYGRRHPEIYVEQNRPQPPTFAKIHRDYLDVETLHYYDLKYEYDVTDPQYIIVLREMTQRETDVLFEHTRRLRSRRGFHPHRLEGQGNGSGSRFTSHLSPRHRSPSRDFYTEGADRWERPELDRVRKHRRKNSIDHGSVRPIVDLQVPPFLAWSTTFEKHDWKDRSGRLGKKSTGVEDDESLRIRLTLLAIKDRIYQVQRNYEGRVRASHLVIYKAGAVIVEIPKSSCPEKLFHEVELGPPRFAEADGKQNLQAFDREMAFLQSQGQIHTDPRTHTSTNLVNMVSAVEPVTIGPEAIGRRVVFWQMARLHVERTTLASTLTELISLFVPQHFDHTLVQRCWGSLESISKVLLDTCKESAQHQAHESNQQSTAIFMVRDIADDEYLEMHQIERLDVAAYSCVICRKEKRYPDVDDALDHLQSAHTIAGADLSATARTQLRHWLVTTSSQGLERRNERLLDFVDTLQACSQKLLSKALNLRNSVANVDNQKSDNYLLPTALVKAAEKVFQYIYYAAHSLQVWKEKGLFLAVPKDMPPLLADASKSTGVEYFTQVANIALSEAQDELMLMAHTGESRDPVLHIPTTPESTILITLFSLADRFLLEGLDTEDLYHKHLARLRYEASRKPSKRVLKELYLWKEEVEVVESVFDQQLEAFRTLKTVLDKDSFRITTQVRVEAFDMLENDILTSTLNDNHPNFKKRMQKLYKEADKLAESLRHNIDIAEEGNSKAIVVFTLVTIVFLPLSFVSSVFGMNTVDVRNMDSSQTLFWAVALPVTAAVGGMALLAAYGGPMLHRHVQALKDLRAEVQSLGSRKQASRDEERQQPDPELEKQIVKAQQVEGTEGRKKQDGFALKKRGSILAKEPKKVPTTRSPREASKVTL